MVKSTPQVKHTVLSKFSHLLLVSVRKLQKLYFSVIRKLRFPQKRFFFSTSESHTVTGCRNGEEFISVSYNIKICVSYTQISKEMVTKCSIL
jgi:hypothetical protein